MLFREWILENAGDLEQMYVYRVDSSPIQNFSSSLRTYARNNDWSSSGTFSDLKQIPSNWKQEQGLFAGTIEDVSPYVIPRDVPWITFTDRNGTKSLVFEKKSVKRIKRHVVYLSGFPSEHFKKLPNGEYFSRRPPNPSSQTKIDDPLSFLSEFYHIRLVDSLEQFAHLLRSKHIQFDSEGM